MSFSKFCIVALCALTSVSACTKYIQPDSNKTIRIKVAVNQTKAEEFTTRVLEDDGKFVMDAWVSEDYVKITDTDSVLVTDRHLIDSDGSANVFYSSISGWSLNPECDWIDGVDTRFWCYAPVSTGGVRAVSDPVASDSDSLSIDYTMPSPYTSPSGKHYDADNCDDIIFAHVNQRYVEGEESISIHFYHAMSQIEFCLSTDDQTFDKSLKLKDISLDNVSLHGVCIFNGLDNTFDWNASLGGGTFTQSYDVSFYPEEPETEDGWIKGSYSSGGKSYNLFTSTNNFFFIPQDNTSNPVTVQATFEDNGTILTPEPVVIKDKWEPGYYYKYKIKATTVGRYIQFTVSLIDWTNFDDKLII